MQNKISILENHSEKNMRTTNNYSFDFKLKNISKRSSSNSGKIYKDASLKDKINCQNNTKQNQKLVSPEVKNRNANNDMKYSKSNSNNSSNSENVDGISENQNIDQSLRSNMNIYSSLKEYLNWKDLTDSRLNSYQSGLKKKGDQIQERSAEDIFKSKIHPKEGKINSGPLLKKSHSFQTLDNISTISFMCKLPVYNIKKVNHDNLNQPNNPKNIIIPRNKNYCSKDSSLKDIWQDRNKFQNKNLNSLSRKTEKQIVNDPISEKFKAINENFKNNKPVDSFNHDHRITHVAGYSLKNQNSKIIPSVKDEISSKNQQEKNQGNEIKIIDEIIELNQLKSQNYS